MVLSCLSSGRVKNIPHSVIKCQKNSEPARLAPEMEHFLSESCEVWSDLFRNLSNISSCDLQSVIHCNWCRLLSFSSRGSMARFTMMAKFLSQPHQIRSLTTVDCWSPSLEENFRLNKIIKSLQSGRGSEGWRGAKQGATGVQIWSEYTVSY